MTKGIDIKNARTITESIHAATKNIGNEKTHAAVESIGNEKAYGTAIISKTKSVAGRNEDITYDDLIEAMSEHWRMSVEGKGFAEDEPLTETALVNTGKFGTKWKCYNCGEVGHLAKDCTKEKRPRSGTLCKLCG